MFTMVWSHEVNPNPGSTPYAQPRFVEDTHPGSLWYKAPSSVISNISNWYRNNPSFFWKNTDWMLKSGLYRNNIPTIWTNLRGGCQINFGPLANAYTQVSTQILGPFTTCTHLLFSRFSSPFSRFTFGRSQHTMIEMVHEKHLHLLWSHWFSQCYHHHHRFYFRQQGP